MADYEAPGITELGSLVELTKGSLGQGSNDFAFSQILNGELDPVVGDSISL
ncbi:MAG: lasso RiPP family leader peptide-containing protein [Microthrixaceae bacterium]